MPTLYGDPSALYARMLRRTVRTEAGCWMFTGATNSRGYSQVSSGRKGRTVLGHQLVAAVHGQHVPAGHNLDHACHDAAQCPGGVDCPHRRCVNPAHIRVLTIGENNARRWDAGLCPRGHILTTRHRGSRIVRCCRVCEADARRSSAA